MSQGRTARVEISVGELIDKITILEIKAQRITAAESLRHVADELQRLRLARDAVLAPSGEVESLTAELRGVNEALWEIEDEIRLCERNRDFGPRFIELARSVYHQNDQRSLLKRRINEASGSALVEEKRYTSY